LPFFLTESSIIYTIKTLCTSSRRKTKGMCNCPFFLLNHQSSIEIKQGFNCSRKCFVQENTPCVLWRRTPGAPKSPDNSANPQSERYRIGRFGGVYGQSKLSNILHANELAGDLRYVFLRLIHDLLFFWFKYCTFM